MVLYDSIAEVMDVKVGIYLGGGEVFMPEQLLDDTKVCPILQEVGGK